MYEFVKAAKSGFNVLNRFELLEIRFLSVLNGFPMGVIGV